MVEPLRQVRPAQLSEGDTVVEGDGRWKVTYVNVTPEGRAHVRYDDGSRHTLEANEYVWVLR